MLTLHLTLTNNQVSVRANGKESHQFSLHDLIPTEKEQQEFFKNPRPYGEKLFNALFRDAARIEFDALSKQPERTIVLVLESPDPSTLRQAQGDASLRASLDGVAWEYAYNKAKEEYVVEDCAFVRALPEKERPANGRMKNEVDRVSLLFIPANPLVDLSGEPMRSLDVEGEWREMKRLIEKSNAPFDMLELRPATPEALQSVMARFQNGMIAHFSGHGAATKDGAILLFERENGASNPLEAREFVREIKDKAWIGFLSACQSAVPERTEFSNLARELAKAGVPFALGMQFNLPDPFAPNISGQFYNYLAYGHAVPEAARQARRAVKRENEFLVGMIALYAAHPDEAGTLRQAQGGWRGAGAQTVNLFRPADVSYLPSPASGLIGRQRELMRIGTRLLDVKKPLTVTLHGAGGIGKTALLWQALLRFAPSFELTLAIGLDPLPSLESVLGRVERFLGLPSPCANETKERETIVRNTLTSKRTLLGLDNFETLNYALNEKGSDEEKTAKSLHTFFKSLAANGVTLCVTCREVTNLGGETIEDIQGLTNENGGRLFQENVVKQKDEIYIEKTQQVSEMVGGHPLALRLLASAFDDQVGISLDQYIESLQSFLPKAHDKWTEEDRHESLRASFAFSMDNLPKNEEGKKLRVAVSRLSVFTSFFMDIIVAPVLENYFPTTIDEFSEIKEQTKNTLHTLWERGLLERSDAFLLETEIYYMYRSHPALRYFAKKYLTDIETVNKNYWQSMRNLVITAEMSIEKMPIWSKIISEALPDLLRATEMTNDMDASLMQFKLSKMLELLGLYNEALRLLRKSGEISKFHHFPQAEAAALYAIAGIYVKQGNLEDALKLYRQSFEVYDSLGNENLKDKANAIVEMGVICNLRGETDKAMRLYQEAYQIYETLGRSGIEGKSNATRHIANILKNRGDLEGAAMLHQQRFKEIQERGNYLEISIALTDTAMILCDLGDFNTAIELLHQALKVFNLLQDQQNKSITLANLAHVYTSRKEPSKATELLEQAIQISHDIGNKQNEILYICALSRALWKISKYEKAILSAFTSLSLLADLDLREQPKVAQSVMSDLYSWRNELGVETFDIIWRKTTGKNIPDWLMYI
ncbi:MAG: tetratricopeptide repeat protein [Chloroflexi bacterium]|nr:tetratricopeptide repeat protein [Chloroflexota bacterium]